MGCGGFLEELVNKTCLFKSGVRAILGNHAKRLCREGNGHCSIEFRYKNALFLKVWAAAHFSARVKLRRTCAIAVAAAYLRALSGYLTDF